MKINEGPAGRIIIAIDDTSIDKIRWIIKATSQFIRIYKIGSIAFTAFGPKLVDEILSLDKDVFLDLKFFDIPNTVYKAVRQAVSMGVKMITLHALGGYEMLKKASEAAGGKATLLGVTLLTSMDKQQLEGIGLSGDIRNIVDRLASNAVHAGMNGLVASGQEAAQLRSRFGNTITIVVPGVRLPEQGASADDQKRIVSPKLAFEAGADYIVIGRPVTESNDPAGVISKISGTLKSTSPNNI
jgi:orotidine-5'-phosphate decarboxylase